MAFLPMTIAMAVMSLGLTSRLLIRFGPMKLLVPGMIAVIAGLLILSRTPVHANYVTSLLPAFLLLGMGMSVSAVPLLTIAMADVPKNDAGLASGIVNVSMWLASSLGLAVFGTLAASKTTTLVAHGETQASALVAGYHVVFLIGALLAAVGLAVTLTVLRSPAKVHALETPTSPSLEEEMEQNELFASGH
jgi:MFS family permease